MNYKIAEIEAIGEAYAAKLIMAGVETSEELLKAGATPKGRKELAEKTGISPKLIMTWVNHADLFRVKGVGPQFAELLEASGVDTVKELAARNPENLAERVREVNDVQQLCKRTPSVGEVIKMVEIAKALDPAVTY